ncbi:MAG: DUF3501 family protein [Rhodospirillales bacterium]|nr:DUF3501 family protein [Rhodospirillales bacterium]
MAKRQLTRADIMPMEAYIPERKERRRALTERKRDRRIAVGPDVTFYFENYDTMWHQVHEMLYIEKGGEDQIKDELMAYNPLIPQGNQLVATMMFEIDDPDRRNRELGRLGGVEDTITIRIGGDVVTAVSETEVERTTDAGKTSSIHFLHFPFTAAQIKQFRDPETEVILSIGHTHYGHMAVISGTARTTLADDFE